MIFICLGTNFCLLNKIIKSNLNKIFLVGIDKSMSKKILVKFKLL